MTHDPYCPHDKWVRDDAIEWWDGCQKDFDCRCEIIAKVRADEREQVGIRIAALTQIYPEGEWGVFIDRARAIDAALGVDDVWC
jgi:hypothetical protein